MKQLSGPITLIKKSFSIYFKKENFIYFLKIYAFLIPFAILSFLFNQSARGEMSDFGSQIAQLGQKFGSSSSIAIMGIVVVLIFASAIISFWVSVAGIKAVSEVARGNLISVSETFRYAWKKIWGVFLVNFLSGLISVGGLLVVFLIWGLLATFYPVITDLSVGSPQIIIGIIRILLIVASLVSFVFVFIFAFWFTFSRFIYIDQSLGVKASLWASKRLVVGKFWKIVGRLFVFAIFGILGQILSSFVPQGLGTTVFTIFGGLFLLPYYLLYQELSADNS